MKRSRSTKAIALGSALVMAGGAGTALAASASTHATKHTTQAGTPPAQLTSGEQTALKAAITAIDAQASSIAKPVLDAAVTAGTITSAQETTLLSMVGQLGSQPAGGPGFGSGGPHGGGGPGGPPGGATGWAGPTGQTGATGSTG
jgi:hypothetical protein